MKYLLIMFFLIATISSRGQKFSLKIDSVISLEIKKVQSRNVSDIGYTKIACVNYGVFTTAYLFWSEEGKTYIQKFEDSDYDKIDVQRFYPKIFIDSVFFPFYRANNNALILEDVKSFEYKTGHFIQRAHSCFRHFRLYTGEIVFDKYFDLFDLDEFNEDQIDNSKIPKERIDQLRQDGWQVDTLYMNKPKRNINYQSNNELKIVEWDLILSECVEKLESANEFIKIEH